MCVVRQDGALFCWGVNSFGKVGDGSTIDVRDPKEIVSVSGVAGVSAGWNYTCVVKKDGTVWCWGYNYWGQLGDGTKQDRLSPVLAVGVSDAVAVSASYSLTCALTKSGSVYCWGGFPAGGAVPMQVPALTDVVSISAGRGGHTCAIKSDGTVACWGENESGQLGNGTTSSSATPVPVGLGLAAVSISAGGMGYGAWSFMEGIWSSGPHTCAVLVDGSVWCWGSNQDGQLGNGNAFKLTPQNVLGL
jgi:alpha-tubulin suppressor-like RCC1 family protein